MIKPVRERIPFFMLQFNALDRPEVRVPRGADADADADAMPCHLLFLDDDGNGDYGDYLGI